MADTTEKSAKSQNEVYEKLNETLQTSVDVMKQLSAAMKSLGESAPTKQISDLVIDLGESKELSIDLGDAVSKSSKIVQSGLMKGEKATSAFHKGWRELTHSVGKKFPVAAAAAIGAIEGLRQGFKNVVAIGKGLLGLFGNLTSTAFNFAAALLAIPLKIYDTLIDAANAVPWSTELAQAIENVRKEFGALSSVAAKTALDLSNSFTGFSETGLGVFQVFGTMAERIEYSRELVKGFGMSLDAFAGEFQKYGGRLAAYQKGLGITAEEFKTFGDLAIATGRTLADVSNEVTKYTLQFSGGVIDKRFSRQLQKAIADVQHFAGATVTQIGRAASYAKNLHVELEKIAVVLDAYETFDQAAENAAKLSQSFGATVDSFKLMKAQTPDEAIDMLRKSLFAAGKDAANMNRQELKLLTQTTGLTAETTKLVFSQKNRGKSLQDIQKEADKAKNTELTQAQAMVKLGDAIERLIKQMETMKGGFFDTFLNGIFRGIQTTPEFFKLMINLKGALLDVWYIGVKLGKWLAGPDGFPGLHKFIVGLTNVFDPKHIKALFNRFVEIIQEGVRDLREGKFSLPKLMDLLKQNFFNFFDKEAGPGRELLDSIKTMMKAVSVMISAGIRYGAQQLGEGLSLLADYISDKKKFDTSGLGQGAGFIESMLTPIFAAVVESWPDLWKSIKKLMSEAWKQLKKYLTSPEFLSIVTPAVFGMFGLLFGPAVVNGVAAGITAFVTKTLITAMVGGTGEAAATSAPLMSKIFTGTLGKVLGAGAVVGLIATMSAGVSQGMEKFNSKLREEFTKSQSVVAAGTTGLVDTLTFGLVSDDVLQSVATGVAKIVETAEKQADKLLPNLGATITDRLAASFKTMGGIGDIIIGIFKGDEDKIGKGIVDTFSGIWDIVLTTIELQVVKIPSLLLKGLTKAFEFLYSIAPILIGKLLQSMGLETLGGGFIAFGNVVKGAFDIIRSSIDFLVAGFDFLWTAVKALKSNLIETLGKGISGYISDTFNAISIAVQGVLKWIGVSNDSLNNWGTEIKKFWTSVKEDLFAIFDFIPKGVKMVVGWIDNLTSKVKGKTAEMKTDLGQDPKATKAAAETAASSVSTAINEGLSAAEMNTANTNKLMKMQNKTVDELLENAATNQDKISSLASGFSKLETQNLVSSMKTVGGIMDAANELDRALSNGNLNKLDVEARLQRVANSVGLKNQKYTIENKMVQITLNLTVTMDAGETEKVLIQRKESIIRDRLNHVNGGYVKSGITGSDKIPGTLTGTSVPAAGNEFES